MTQEELKAWADTLTPEQLYAAWRKQQDNYEEEDIINELDNNGDWYAEKYGIDEQPITDEEFADIVDVFSQLWNSEDYRYTEAREAAVIRVLARRKGSKV